MDSNEPSTDRPLHQQPSLACASEPNWGIFGGRIPVAAPRPSTKIGRALYLQISESPSQDQMTARDAALQRALSPGRDAKMDVSDGRASRQNGSKRPMHPEDLVDFTRRMLDESAERQRAVADHTELPIGWTPSAGDTLDLSSRGAAELPVEVVELIKDRVERLALSHNSQILLPPEIGQCSRLFYLNLRWNNFTTFPEAVLKLTTLQTLDVSRNRISSIPEEVKSMTSLKFLAFTNNQVTRLPLCLGDMPTLTKLKFDDNPIEFPPPEEFAPSSDAVGRIGFDSNTHTCAQVKRFLKQTLIRERQKQEMDAELSETNVETPRPPKRTLIGRFPVRPSMNGIDTSEFMGSGTANGDPRLPMPPPIPQKSSARDSLVIAPIRRPGLAPLDTDGYASRSRSETVATGGQRLKRLGFVPTRKVSGPPSANAIAHDGNTLKPNHFRNASFSSALGANSGGDMSSEAVSPVDGQNNRPWMSKSRLSSLPEDRRVSKITSPTIRSARLLVYSLDQLNRPVDDVIRIIKNGTPRKNTVERMHYNATQNLKELDRQLHLLTPMAEDQGQESTAHVRAILKRSRYCVQAYHHVITELRLNARKMVIRGEPMYLRTLMMQIYTTLVEVRNACNIQEAALATPPKLPRAPRAVSDRTVTPTQAKPLSKRTKGARIIAGWRDKSPGSMPYAGPLMSASSSRTNTLTSMTSATPKSGESFGAASMSRSNTQYSQSTTDSDEERQFERIYLNLRHVCELADQTLPNCRMDFFVRKEGAARSMQGSAARAWTLALNRCDGLMNALELLKKRLARVRVNDPSIRTSRDFWHVCDSFVRAWYDLASEMKNLGNQGLDIGAIKVMLRPVQKAVKDVGHILNHSPVYKGSLKPQSASTRMPPTPLSAALGPAVQATVPNTPSVISPAEYLYSYNYAKERERADTVTSRYGDRGTRR